MSVVQDWFESLKAEVRTLTLAAGNERLLAGATGKLRGSEFVVEGLGSPVLAQALLQAADRIPRPSNVKSLAFTGFTRGPLERPAVPRKRRGRGAHRDKLDEAAG